MHDLDWKFNIQAAMVYHYLVQCAADLEHAQLPYCTPRVHSCRLQAAHT